MHRPGETIARYVERLKLARHCSRVMGHSGSGSRTGSTPFPQLLPGLDECLHLSGTRKTVVNQPAILIRLLVQITNRRHAEVREAVTEFFEVLLAQNLRLLAIRRARHGEGDFSMFAICSPTTVLCDLPCTLAPLARPFGQERETGEKPERAVGGASAAAGLRELASMDFRLL